MNNNSYSGGSRIFPDRSSNTTAAASLRQQQQAPQDKYDRFEDWLRENGAHFERVCIFNNENNENSA